MTPEDVLTECLRWAYAAPYFTLAFSFLALFTISLTIVDLTFALVRRIIK